MGFFKQRVSLEDFCRHFYEDLILSPSEGEIDGIDGFAEVAKKTIAEADSKFSDVDLQKLKDELTFLRFELFALAWTHRFVGGKTVVAQSVFTKNYLHEKGRDDIWLGMGDYNDSIYSATLKWLASLGEVNMPYNYRMMNTWNEENKKVAKEMGISVQLAGGYNDVLSRIDSRTWSENAWRYKFILTFLQLIFYKNLNVNPETLNDEALAQGAIIIKGLYDGAKQSLDNIKI